MKVPLQIRPPNTPVNDLNFQKGNLFSITYKKVTGSLHARGIIMSSIEQKEQGRKNK
jgi:hypothetical protein